MSWAHSTPRPITFRLRLLTVLRRTRVRKVILAGDCFFSKETAQKFSLPALARLAERTIQYNERVF
jgi:hypothetical protein